MTRPSRRELETRIDRIVADSLDSASSIIIEDQTGRHHIDGEDVTVECFNGTYDRENSLTVSARAHWMQIIDPDTLEVVGREPLTAEAVRDAIIHTDVVDASAAAIDVEPAEIDPSIPIVDFPPEMWNA